MGNSRPRQLVCALLLMFASAFAGAQSTEAESARMAAAERLFLTPGYRQLATRQIYETLKSLPPEQSQAALSALRDPAVVNAMRQVISRAMANTYSIKELDFLHKIFGAPEMESFIRRENVFRDQLQREFTAALLTNPALIGRIPMTSGK